MQLLRCLHASSWNFKLFGAVKVMSVLVAAVNPQIRKLYCRSLVLLQLSGAFNQRGFRHQGRSHCRRQSSPGAAINLDLPGAIRDGVVCYAIASNQRQDALILSTVDAWRTEKTVHPAWLYSALSKIEQPTLANRGHSFPQNRGICRTYP